MCRSACSGSFTLVWRYLLPELQCPPITKGGGTCPLLWCYWILQGESPSVLQTNIWKLLLQPPRDQVREVLRSMLSRRPASWGLRTHVPGSQVEQYRFSALSCMASVPSSSCRLQASCLCDTISQGQGLGKALCVSIQTTRLTASIGLLLFSRARCWSETSQAR